MHLQSDGQSDKCVGRLIRYERDWYYWELVILARRAGLVLVTLATAVPSLQIWFGLTVIVATMTVHFYARPFIDDSLDLLETTSLVGLIGLMMTGDGLLQYSLSACEDLVCCCCHFSRK